MPKFPVKPSYIEPYTHFYVSSDEQAWEKIKDWAENVEGMYSNELNEEKARVSVNISLGSNKLDAEVSVFENPDSKNSKDKYIVEYRRSGGDHFLSDDCYKSLKAKFLPDDNLDAKHIFGNAFNPATIAASLFPSQQDEGKPSSKSLTEFKQKI